MLAACARSVALPALALASAALAQPVQRSRSDWPEGFRPAVADPQEVEGLILERTNAFRRQQGLPELAEDARLTESARDFARYLARTGRFSHTADGRDPSERVRAAGYDYCEIAENIASSQDSSGFQSAPLAREFVEGWKNSPGHRRNLLNGNVVEIGVGVAPAPGAPGKYVAVQDFGRPVSMRYSFKVANRTDRPATYWLDDQAVRIGAYTVITHTACRPQTLKLAASTSVQPAPGAVYTVGP
jgi:uncharacterized protein YkwD